MAFTKLQPWILGDRAVRQPSFVARLRAGGSPHIATVDRFRRWMREQMGADRQAFLTAVSRNLFDRPGPKVRQHSYEEDWTETRRVDEREPRSSDAGMIRVATCYCCAA